MIINMDFESYCSFPLSKLLKERGFHWANLFPIRKTPDVIETVKLESGYYSCYNQDGKVIRPKFYNPNNTHYPRPTHDVAIAWVKQKFGVTPGIELTEEAKEIFLFDTLRKNEID